MVLAAPGPLLTSPPSSSPLKTPHRSSRPLECPSREEASQAHLKQLPTCHTTQELTTVPYDSQKRTYRDSFGFPPGTDRIQRSKGTDKIRRSKGTERIRRPKDTVNPWFQVFHILNFTFRTHFPPPSLPPTRNPLRLSPNVHP
jgi:hypothetical protein